MLKSALIYMAPDGDPNRYRASIKTSKAELISVIIEIMNFDQAVNVCRDLVQKQGVQVIILCPGFTHEAVARVTNAVGEKAAVHVSRGDPPSAALIGGILVKEGWLPEGHQG